MERWTDVRERREKALAHLSMSYFLRCCVAATVVKARSFAFGGCGRAGGRGSTARSGSAGSACVRGSEKTRGPFWRKNRRGAGRLVSFSSWRLAPPPTPTSLEVKASSQ